MKNLMSFSALVGLTLFIWLNAFDVFADHLCRQAVSYHWLKEKEEKPTAVHWTSVEVQGVDEAAAKVLLDEPTNREKKRALEECQKEHENMAGCVAAKYSSLAATMERLAFTQRKGIEEAVQVDCKARQGRCKEVVVGDPQCWEIIKKEAAASPAAEEKKDAKAKKK